MQCVDIHIISRLVETLGFPWMFYIDIIIRYYQSLLSWWSKHFDTFFKQTAGGNVFVYIPIQAVGNLSLGVTGPLALVPL